VEEGRTPEFLPPKPTGPEPELGPAPRPAYQPPAGAAPPGQWAPQGQLPAQPDNGAAVTGFVLSLVGGSLLLVTAGFSSLVSVGLAIAGIVLSRRGSRRVASGETRKHAGLAQAGFVIGIVSLVLAVVATIAWIAVLVLALTDDGFRDDFERRYDDQTVQLLPAARPMLVVARLAVALVA
jgi:hypothetical protein